VGISSLRVTEYYMSCDGEGCDYCDNVVNLQEGIHNQQQAIKWANMHKLKDGRILCDTCFQKYKQSVT
jgi:hypothetical protein